MHPSKPRRPGVSGPPVSAEDIDTSSFMDPNDAAAHFKRAEKHGTRRLTA